MFRGLVDATVLACLKAQERDIQVRYPGRQSSFVRRHRGKAVVNIIWSSPDKQSLLGNDYGAPSLA